MQKGIGIGMLALLFGALIALIVFDIGIFAALATFLASTFVFGWIFLAFYLITKDK